jgi:hypothetical protein
MIWLLLRVLQNPSRNRRLWKRVRLCIIACIILPGLDLLCDQILGPSPHEAPIVEAQELNHISSVFITSAQYNSEEILKASWIPSLLQLVKELQSVNITIYISIYESGSEDGTKAALSELKGSLEKLEINHEIKLDLETHALAIENSLSTSAGWMETRYGKELRRIVFLANIRNRALKPLDSLTKAGTKFDKILFLNDVVFSVNFPRPAMVSESLIFHPGQGRHGPS